MARLKLCSSDSRLNQRFPRSSRCACILPFTVGDRAGDPFRGLLFRGYRAGDLDALFAIDVECFAHPFRFPKALLKRFAEKRGALTVIAEAQCAIVGFVIVHLQRIGTGKVGYVVTLDVREAFRRCGLGARLMREGERLARDKGAARMRLHVFAGDRGARTFYRRMGYGECGVAAHFYGQELHALVLEKGLEGSASGG